MRYTNKCLPEDIALKSFFLGPMAENAEWLKETVNSILEQWCSWRKSCYPSDGGAISDRDQNDPAFREMQRAFRENVNELVLRFHSEIPKFSPRYMGHMFSEISLPALLGHWVALLQNPNNISSESSRVGVVIEQEAVQALARMVGYREDIVRGHFTSGGSVANFEAVFRALERAQQMGISRERGVLLLPLHAHYSWKKSLKVFGIPEKNVAWLELDDRGRVDLVSYDAELRRLRSLGSRPVLCVGVVGSTEIGAMDPIEGMKILLDDTFPESKCWFHVDAAYGGFYAALGDPPSAVRSMCLADSLTLDPHKLGYVPYAAGAFLCQNSKDYYSVSTDAPYVQYEKNVDSGPFTLEGSRSATGAAAVWMVEKTLGLRPEGLGRIIKRTMDVRSEMLSEIQKTGGVVTALEAGDSNIICLLCPRKGELVSETNRRTLTLYHRLNGSEKPAFTVSKTLIDRFRYDQLLAKTVEKWGGRWDTEEESDGLVVLRLCLMNPFTGSKEMRPKFTREVVQLICSESLSA